MRTLALTLLILAACGGGGADDDTPDPVDAAEADSAPGSPDAGIEDAAPDAEPPSPDAGPTPGVEPVGVEMMIGATGGTVEIPGFIRLVIPPGALPASAHGPGTLITLRPTGGYYGDEVNPGRALSGMFEIGPAGTTFAVPATVTLTMPRSAPASATPAMWSADGESGPYAVLASTRIGDELSAAISATLRVIVGDNPTVSTAASTCAIEGIDPFVLHDVFVGGGSDPQVVRPSGDARVGFYDKADALMNVWMLRMSPDGLSGTRDNITDNTVHTIYGGAHAEATGGDLVWAYRSNQTAGYQVWIKRTTSAGVNVGAAFRLSTPPAGDLAPFVRGEPEIAATDTGFVVVWNAENAAGTIACVRAAHLSPSLTPGETIDLTACTAGAKAYQPGFASDGERGFVAYLRAPIATETAIFGQVVDADGNPRFEEVRVTAVEPDMVDDFYDIPIVAAADGVATISWADGLNVATHLHSIDLATSLPVGHFWWSGMVATWPTVAARGTGWVVGTHGAASFVIGGNAVVRDTPVVYRVDRWLTPIEAALPLFDAEDIATSPNPNFPIGAVSAPWRVSAGATGNLLMTWHDRYVPPEGMSQARQRGYARQASCP